MANDRQRVFLATFQRMSPEAQKTLREIYERAHSDGSSRTPGENLPVDDGREHHVVMAMRAATRFPDIFRLTMMNLATRVVLKIAQQSGNVALARKKQEMLDDFHVALDSFCGELSIEAISAEGGIERRILHPQRKKTDFPYLWLITDPDRVTDILTFKDRSRPAVAKIRHLHQHRR